MSIFNEKDEELAKTLGFQNVGPGPKPFSPAETHTYVKGYVNSNAYDLAINISSAGVSMLLKAGEAVVIDGQKINDPVLDQHVGPRKLSRELSKVKVPIIRFPRVEKSAPVHPVQAVKSFSQGKRGLVVEKMEIQPPAKQTGRPTVSLPPPGQQAFIGMSMETAHKLKLIKPVLLPQESNVVDTSGIPPSGIPNIEIARDVRSPKELQLAKQRMQEQLQREAAEDAQKTSQKLSSDQLTEINSGNSLELTKTMEPKLPTGDGPAPIEESSVVAPAELPAESDDLAMVDASTMTSPPKMINLIPPVNIEEAPAQPATTSSKPKFGCPVCSQGFPYRSDLERHVRLKHTDQYDAIMIKFPRTSLKTTATH